MNRPVPLTDSVQHIVNEHEAVIIALSKVPIKDLSFDELRKYAVALSDAQSIYEQWGHHEAAEAHGRRLHIVAAEAKRRKAKPTDKPGANHYGN